MIVSSFFHQLQKRHRQSLNKPLSIERPKQRGEVVALGVLYSKQIGFEILSAMTTKAKRKEEEEETTSKQSEATADAFSLMPYVCVYCGTPCACLYRQLNKKSLSSIKAMHCENCHRIVDPYIEREWLLVLLDCILLRPEAYRHVLYNNQDISWYVRSKYNKNEETSEEDENKAVSGSRIPNLVQWTLVSGLFHALLKWKALLHTQQEKQHIRYGVSMPLELISVDSDSSTFLRGLFVATSFLDFIAQWMAIYGFLKLVSRNDTKTSHSIGYQIYLALLLPTSFQIICILVLLWEDSKTAMALGSLLIAFWQCLGISLISMQNCSSKQRLMRICVPLVGIISLMAWRFTIEQVLANVVISGNATVVTPCVGFEFDVFEVVGLVSTGDCAHAFEWLPSPLLLCLT